MKKYLPINFKDKTLKSSFSHLLSGPKFLTRVFALQQKKKLFAWQKQSIQMSIKDFPDMTNLLCLICFFHLYKNSTCLEKMADKRFPLKSER